MDDVDRVPRTRMRRATTTVLTLERKPRFIVLFPLFFGWETESITADIAAESRALFSLYKIPRIPPALPKVREDLHAGMDGTKLGLIHFIQINNIVM